MPKGVAALKPEPSCTKPTSTSATTTGSEQRGTTRNDTELPSTTCTGTTTPGSRRQRRHGACDHKRFERCSKRHCPSVFIAALRNHRLCHKATNITSPPLSRHTRPCSTRCLSRPRQSLQVFSRTDVIANNLVRNCLTAPKVHPPKVG